MKVNSKVEDPTLSLKDEIGELRVEMKVTNTKYFVTGMVIVRSREIPKWKNNPPNNVKLSK